MDLLPGSQGRQLGIAMGIEKGLTNLRGRLRDCVHAFFYILMLLSGGLPPRGRSEQIRMPQRSLGIPRQLPWSQNDGHRLCMPSKKSDEFFRSQHMLSLRLPELVECSPHELLIGRDN